MLQSGTHAKHFGVGLGMNQAGKPIASLAANACAIGHILFVEHDSTGGGKGVKTCRIQVVEELLDARLMGYRWIGIWCTRRGFGRVYTADAVHLIHLLGLCVKGLHVSVADRPGRRESVVVVQFAEVLPSQTV